MATHESQGPKWRRLTKEEIRSAHDRKIAGSVMMDFGGSVGLKRLGISLLLLLSEMKEDDTVDGEEDAGWLLLGWKTNKTEEEEARQRWLEVSGKPMPDGMCWACLSSSKEPHHRLCRFGTQKAL